MCMHYSIRLGKKKNAVISVLFQSDKVLGVACSQQQLLDDDEDFNSQPEKGDHGNDVLVDSGGSGSMKCYTPLPGAAH